MKERGTSIMLQEMKVMQGKNVSQIARVSIPGQVAPPVRLCDTAIPLERYHHSGK